MSRWIELEPLIEAMGEEPYVWNDEADEIAERNQWLTDIHIIDSAPSIDLVRCGECIHFTKLSDGWGRCNAHGRTAQTIDFCSWAERKESE